MYKTGILHTILYTVAMLLLLACFAWIMDPYQVFRDHWFHTPTYSPRIRLQAPGLIRTFITNTDEYDTVILGTSLSQNYAPNLASKALSGKKALQLSISAGSPKEQNTVLNKALETGKIKNVLIGIHAFYANTDVNHLGRKDFPDYLYTGLPIEYLFSLQTIQKGILVFFQRTEWQSNVDRLVNWTKSQQHYFESFNSPANLRKLANELKEKRKTAKQSARQADINTFPSIDTYIIDMARNYPGVDFHCILPPYSTLYYALLDRDELFRLLAMEKYLVEQSNKLGNLDVYSFQNMFAITDNLANYRDPEHFSEAVSDMILNKIIDGALPITAKDWLKTEKIILEKAAKYEIFSQN